MTTTTTAPRVYVGTYHKYNCGSLAGAWLDLDDYADADDFYDACRQLHGDEADPELMFQDREGCPSEWVEESHISPHLWEWLELNDDQRDMVTAYINHQGDHGATVTDIVHRYNGCTAGSFQDWCIENFGHEIEERFSESDPEGNVLVQFFDWRAWAKYLSHDYVTACGDDGYLHIWSNR